MNFDDKETTKLTPSDEITCISATVMSSQPSESDPVNTPATNPDIKLNEFLELLQLSCSVNDMITDTNSTKDVTSSTSEVDFTKLAENPLVNKLLDHTHQDKNQNQVEDNSSVNTEPSNAAVRRSSMGLTFGSFPRRSTKRDSNNSHLPAKLNEKLEYCMNEGMLDSVLSFICPVPAPGTFPNRPKLKHREAIGKAKVIDEGAVHVVEVSDGDNGACGGDGPLGIKSEIAKESKKSAIRRKSLFPSKEKKEQEVIIHVCDEVNNLTRDFSCPQKLLVTKMGYFADVTAGQKLEEMDISVHCDIQIFDWLMKWMKYNEALEQAGVSRPVNVNEFGPQLDANNVVPILVSASFLQMEPLLLDCLTFCHAHLNEVVRSTTNISCLNETIITRLAAMFTNYELEMVRDKRDRLAPRLWIKMIQSLCEPEPEALRGHYFSLAGLFRCARCGECLTNTIQSYVCCVPNSMRLNRWGQLVSYHVRDPDWSMSSYIAQIFKEMKSWRRVYWKLWGHCHFLYCCICETHFPVYQMTWCRFHPLNPNFLGPINESCIAGPAGRYPCCNQQAFRYETLPGPNGCKTREHSVLVETDRERSILHLAQIVMENCALDDCPPQQIQETIANGEAEPNWLGLPLTPQRCRQGLLPIINPDDPSTLAVARRMHQSNACYHGSSSDTESSECGKTLKRAAVEVDGATCRDYYSSSDGCESEYSNAKVVYKKKGKKRVMHNPGRHWSGDLSARSNQDHQREYEEKVMKQVSAIVTKKTGSDHSLTQVVAPMGGSYLRLEAEWKDQVKQRNPNVAFGIAKTKNSK